MSINDLHANDLRDSGSVLTLRVAGMPYPSILNGRNIAQDKPKTSWSWWDDDTEPDVVMRNGVAIVRVNGIIRPESRWWSSTAGLEDLTNEVVRLTNDVNVTRTVFRGTTCGGFPDRLEDFKIAVKEHSKVKPIDFFGTDMLASGGYWMAAPFDSIWCDSLAAIGALGVFTILLDTSNLWEEMGIFTTLINDNPDGVKGHSSDDKVSKRLIEETMRSISEISEVFRSTVKEGRGFTDEQILSLFTGQLWTGEKALELGLVDGVKPWFKYIEDVVGGSVQTSQRGDRKGSEMEEDNDERDVATAMETVSRFFSNLSSGKRRKKKVDGASITAQTQQEEVTTVETKLNGKDYMMISAQDQMRSYVATKLGETSATPGMKKTPGLDATLCLLGTFSVFGDSKRENAELVSVLESVYDLGDRCQWSYQKMSSLAFDMWPETSDPFGTVLAALGNSPEFLAGEDRFANLSVKNGGNSAGEVAPKGGGVSDVLSGGPWSGMSKASQELVKAMSNGVITDDASYLQYNPTMLPRQGS